MVHGNGQIISDYERFREDFKLSLENNTIFCDYIKHIMDSKGITIDELVEKSRLSKQTVHRLRSGKHRTMNNKVVDYLPEDKTLIAFCIACQLDMMNAMQLFGTLGRGFIPTSEVHYAYCYLITNCRGRTITECNEVLGQLGIEEKDLLRDLPL